MAKPLAFVKYGIIAGEYAPKHPEYAIQHLTYGAYVRGRHGTVCDIRGIRDRQTQYAECADCVLEVSTCGGRSGVCQAVTCPSPSSCGGQDGASALMYSASLGHTEAVKALIKAGAEKDLQANVSLLLPPSLPHPKINNLATGLSLGLSEVEGLRVEGSVSG